MNKLTVADNIMLDNILGEFGSDIIIQHFDEDTLLNSISIEAVIDKFGRKELSEKLADDLRKIIEECKL
jgi:hypothetical protein